MMSGAAYHFLGNQAAARASLETALQPARLPRWGSFTGLGYDPRVIAVVALARTLWLSGCPDQAAKAARYAIERAESLGQPLTLGISLLWNAYVFLWTGDWQSAHEIIERLVAHAERGIPLGHIRRSDVGYGVNCRSNAGIQKVDLSSFVDVWKLCMRAATCFSRPYSPATWQKVWRWSGSLIRHWRRSTVPLLR